MAAGVTLQDMATDLRATLGQSMNAAHGIDQQPGLYAALRRTQTELWQVHDWPALIVQVDLPLDAGVRTLAVPTGPAGVDFEHINEIWVRPVDNSARRYELDYGIGQEQYALHDSVADARSSPVQRWQFWGLGAGQPTGTIEVWPIPDADFTITFVGRRFLLPLIATTDVCTLDSELIVAQTAVPIMMRNKDPTAQLQLSKAQALLNKLRARQGSNKRKPFLMGSRI